ncbi:hypothetical protein H8B02_18500 [Bradyrhizobium sp. Pear77]|uniref:hypothetical protein n=1 Tax=Bradyrhizobium altum TaxID=1571202 RepID=UPI001E319E58|nr:hypothetical protein [Bradyrhizobium altum]MCC8955352.1 hypothetical protein [Bradyrhizobium altum]
MKSSIDTGDELTTSRRRHPGETIAKNFETSHGLLDLGTGCAFSEPVHFPSVDATGVCIPQIPGSAVGEAQSPRGSVDRRLDAVADGPRLGAAMH